MRAACVDGRLDAIAGQPLFTGALNITWQPGVLAPPEMTILAVWSGAPAANGYIGHNTTAQIAITPTTVFGMVRRSDTGVWQYPGGRAVASSDHRMAFAVTDGHQTTYPPVEAPQTTTHPVQPGSGQLVTGPAIPGGFAIYARWLTTAEILAVSRWLARRYSVPL